MPNKITHEEFIKRSNTIHNNFYKYPEVYKEQSHKIKIECPIHGIFEQRAKNHMDGYGCKECGFIKIKERMNTHSHLTNDENVKLFHDNKRKCCKCEEIKALDEFTKAKGRFMGVSSRCKACDLIYRQENDVKYKKGGLEWRKLHRQELCDKEKARREKIGIEAFTIHRKKLYKLNKEKHRARRKERMEDPLFKIQKRLRDRLYQVIKQTKAKKVAHTKELLGCEFEEFKTYIEGLWTPGMCWDNYGLGKDKWVIDHIIPCASFNMLKEEDQRTCFFYKNLQPLWFHDNAIKSSYHNGVKHYYKKEPSTPITDVEGQESDFVIPEQEH